MVLFAHCKINLGLKIIRRRPDGYHDLETVFYPLPLKDALEIIRQPDQPHPAHNPTVTDPPSPTSTPPESAGPTTTTFTAYGLPIPGEPSANLCLKAWHLLKTDFPDLPPVQIHLLKQIPIGAGLGGGSADGASTLKGLNAQFSLNLSTEQLLHYAALLGSDCPFFIYNTPCLGHGRGDLLQPIDLDLTPYTLCLVDPGIHISTAKAFAGCTPADNPIPLPDLLRQPVSNWRDTLVNDFETPLFALHPELQTVKTTLYAHGALYASLTGSGSSFYGIFQKGQAPPASPFPASYNYRILQ